MNIKLILTIAFISLISFLMQWWQTDFIYTRDALDMGQWWRIITGQLVHTNWAHYLLNVSSLWLLALLFYNTLNAKTFTISLLLLVVSIGSCVHFFVPSIHWYAGLSGAIYGIYVVAAYEAIKQKDYLMGVGVGVLIIGKVIADHFMGPVNDTSGLIGARVVTEAHDFGVMSALVLIALDACYQYTKRNLDKS
ncbi:rhombosortase [Leucothrix sargassi]|nr:rhombosortase [Leucothrix sargassi]